MKIAIIALTVLLLGGCKDREWPTNAGLLDVFRAANVGDSKVYYVDLTDMGQSRCLVVEHTGVSCQWRNAPEQGCVWQTMLNTTGVMDKHGKLRTLKRKWCLAADQNP